MELRYLLLLMACIAYIIIESQNAVRPFESDLREVLSRKVAATPFTRGMDEDLSGSQGFRQGRCIHGAPLRLGNMLFV